MRNKKYLGLIFMILIFGVMDNGRQWLQLINTKKSIEHLNNIKLSMNNKMQNPPIKNIKKEKIMNEILLLVEASELSAQLISVKEAGGGDAVDNFDLILSGNFQQLIQFFKTISKQCLPFFIDYFGLNNNKNEWSVKIRLRIFPSCQNSLNVIFRERQQKNIKMASAIFSIRQLKFAGFLRYGNHLDAIISSPDKISKEIKVGDTVGREQGKVIYIDENKIVVQVNQKIIPILKK